MEPNFWIALLVVVMFVLGSVVWVRPSPRDIKLANWRREALVAGLKVKLEGFKADPKESGIRDDIEGASYQLFNDIPAKHDKLVWAVVLNDGWLKDGLPEGWSWYKEKADAKLIDRISEQIEKAPLDIVGIERTPYMSRIVWSESGKNFDPQALKQFLQEVQTIV